MNGDRFFMDTAFVLAVVNPKDTFHEAAKALLPRVRAAREVWLHDGILIEVANGLAGRNRSAAVDFIENSYNEANTHVVPLARELLNRAIELYRNRPDKDWGLTDCILFVIMQDEGLTDALTSDYHFVQSGFRALLRES
jgi:uncharacterized protein